MTTERELVIEFQGWCDSQSLPQMSADELLHEDITTLQRAYLQNFLARWKKMARIQELEALCANAEEQAAGDDPTCVTADYSAWRDELRTLLTALRR